MGVVQGSTLYGGSVSKAAIYEIHQGAGFAWGDFVSTEIAVDGKPRQLTRSISGGNPIRANVSNPRDADFVGSAGITIDGRQLVVSELMVPEKMDALTWKETFPEYQPNGKNIDLKMNPKIQSTVFSLIMESVKTQMNALHSAGNTAGATEVSWYDGFETLILADADPTQVGTPAVLTSANILDSVYALRNAIPPRLRSKPNLKFFCSYADYDLYDVARRKTQTQLAETDIVGSGVVNQSSTGSRINMIPMEGISKNFIFATVADKTPSSNLVQGVWVPGDSETLKVYKTEEADQEFKILMRFDMGVQYRSGLDIFYLNNV